MKKSVYPAQLPVSRKAYKGFVNRINTVLGNSETASAMVHALDLYLEGGKDYAAGLDAQSRMAFEFLRQEIDIAVERSRKARARAALRRRQHTEATAPTPSPTGIKALEAIIDTTEAIIKDEATVDTFVSQVNEYFGIDETQARPLSRHQRRAIARTLKGKSYIKALNQYHKSRK